MEQVHYQWLVQEQHEEEEQVQDAGLKGRKSLQHRKDVTLNGVGLISTSSFSPETNGGGRHSNNVSLASVDETLLQKEEEPHTMEEEGEEEEPLFQEEEELTSQKEEQVEEMANDVENGNNIINDNHAAVGLGVVGELVGAAATNGEAIDSAIINFAASQNMNIVYFDKQEGMWKCHHCSWTKRFDSAWNVPIGNLNGYSDLLMNVKLKTVIQHGPCFVWETKGIEFNGLKGVQDADGARPVLQRSQEEGEIDIQVENSVMQSSLRNETNNQCMKTIDDKVPFSPEISPLQNASEVQATTVENLGDKRSAETGPNLMKEIDQQLEELDVEAVLAKQETHDLFCPNCNSCITKRVILKKRKRNIKHIDTKAKRDKLDTKMVNGSTKEVNQGDHAIAASDVGSIEQPPADNYEPEREPEVFRCLSCFSFFIPLRNGFKLFPTFGGPPDSETSQNPSITSASNLENPPSIAASKENWFFSLFTSNERKKARGQGDSSVENPRPGPAEHHQSSSPSTSNVLTSSQIGKPEGQLADTAINKNTQPTPDTKTGHGGVNSFIPSPVKSVMIRSQMGSSANSCVPSGKEPLADHKCVNSSFQYGLSPIQSPTQNSSDVRNGEKNIGMDFIDIPTKERSMNYNVWTDMGEKKNDSVDMTNKGLQESQSPAQLFGSEEFANDVTSDKASSGVDATIPSDLDFMKMQKDIEEDIKHSVSKGYQEAFKSSTSQIVDDVPDKGATDTVTHTEIDIAEEPRAETAEHQEWEIVKSIVYGGLIELITSLGIVSSAASSGATPLNIIALGLANLIGGLFVIGHDLIDLKNDRSEEMNMQEDRYHELLGRRANFLLHAVVAVLSFLISGSVPLVVYGLLIRKNYNAEVKLLVVAATSVVCIGLLAIGKAYTKRSPPKSYIKTVLKYVTMALATSGVSYIAGDLVKDLVERFSGRDSGVVLNMPSSSTATRMEPVWMSY